MKKNPYDVLGVSSTDTFEAVRKKYRLLSIRFHPDKNQSNSDSAEKFRELNEAWQILSDPTKKLVLDDNLAKSRIEKMVPVAEKAVASWLDSLAVAEINKCPSKGAENSYAS